MLHTDAAADTFIRLGRFNDAAMHLERANSLLGGLSESNQLNIDAVREIGRLYREMGR
jgi:hypothetical protein